MSRVLGLHLARLAFAVLLSAASFPLLACDPDPGATDAGEPDAGQDLLVDGAVLLVPCTVEAPSTCPDPPPRFADVTPIFKARCASCHASDWSGPWPLDTYSHVADWADSIRGHLIDCTMPPPEAGMPLPDDESSTILTWIRCNTPR